MTSQQDRPEAAVRFATFPLNSWSDRISEAALAHFVQACQKQVVLALAGDSAQRRPLGRVLQCSIALLPSGTPQVEVQSRLHNERLDALVRDALLAVPAPVVRKGAVGLVIAVELFGGARTQVRFERPFSTLSPFPGPWDEEFSLEESRSLWRRWIDKLGDAYRALLARWTGPEPEAAPVFTGPSTRELPRDLFGLNHDEVEAALRRAEESRLKQWTRESPEFLDAWLELGERMIHRERPETAVAYCDRLAARFPAAARVYDLRGAAHFLAGQRQPALADFNHALQLDPHSPAGFVRRGVLYLDLEAYPQARSDFSSAIQLAPMEAEYYLQRAKTWFAEENLQRYVRDLDEALRLDPHLFEAYAMRGFGKLRLAEEAAGFEDAVRDFSSALVGGRHASILNHRAEAYLRLGKLESAVEDCTEALELEPDNAMAAGIRGHAHQLCDRLEEAFVDCDRAISLGCDAPAVYVSRAICHFSRGDQEAAMQDCDAAIRMAPDFAAAFNCRGMLRTAAGDTAGAMEDFARASELEPNWGVPHANRANLQRAAQDLDSALEQYTRSIELEPTEALPRLQRGLTYIDLGRTEEALHDLREALELDPTLDEAQLAIAQAYFRQEEHQLALEAVNVFLQRQPESPAGYQERAQILIRLRREREALDDLHALVRLRADAPGAYMQRGNLLARLGDSEASRADFDTAKELAPEAAEEIEAHFELARISRELEQEAYDAAVQKATELLQSHPDLDAARAMRAVAYFYSEQYVEAIDDYNAMLEDPEKDLWALNGRGQVYVELREFELAAADLTAAIELARQARERRALADALSGRGMANAGLGLFDKAWADLAESARLSGDNAWLHYNIAQVHLLRGERAEAAAAFRRALALQDPKLPPFKVRRARAFLQSQAPPPESP